MIKYRLCVDKESEWFEYRNTFEEIVEVARDLFEEANKIFYNGHTNFGHQTKNGNRSCAIKFIEIDGTAATVFTKSVLRIDEDYQERKQREHEAYLAKKEIMNELSSRELFTIATTAYNTENKSEEAYAEYRIACRLLAERKDCTEYEFRRYYLFCEYEAVFEEED